MSRPDKGKGRAAVLAAEESRPLLSSSSSSASAEFTVDTPATGPTHRRWQRHAVIVAVSSISLGLFVFLALVGLAIAGIPRGETQNLWKHVTVKEPVVHVLDVTDSGVHVNISAVGGVDIKGLVKGEGHGFWERLRRRVAYTISPVVPSSVDVRAPAVLIYAQGGELPVLNVTLPGSISVPLMFNTKPAPFSIEAVGQPMASVGEVWSWAQEAWAAGEADVMVGVPEVSARIWGFDWLSYATKDLAANITVPVPELANMPKPGKPLDLAKLVQLHDYSFTNGKGLQISATASLPNPGLGKYSIPYALPFRISGNGTELAQVVAQVSNVSSKVFNLTMAGNVSVASGGEAVEGLLRRFLRGKDSPIVVQGLSHLQGKADLPPPPQWVLDSLSTLSLDLVFPGPEPKPEVIKSVTIEGMRISEAEGHVAASGTVVAIVELPPGFQSVNANVTAIQPDVFVFDGPAEETSDPGDDGEEDRPDPANPPERAFGHIAPDYYLGSTTTPYKSIPGAFEVRAQFADMPLQVLDGRQAVFRKFISKVIFSGGATAGIGGVADIMADLGLSKPLSVAGLPVHGEFWVGRARGEL